MTKEPRHPFRWPQSHPWIAFLRAKRRHFSTGCAVFLAVALIAQGCGGGASNGTKRLHGLVPTSKVGTAIAAHIKATHAGEPGVASLTLSCARTVKIKHGNNFGCNLLTQRGKAFAGTVLVVVASASGTSYRYSGDFNGQSVSGKLTVK